MPRAGIGNRKLIAELSAEGKSNKEISNITGLQAKSIASIKSKPNLKADIEANRTAITQQARDEYLEFHGKFRNVFHDVLLDKACKHWGKAAELYCKITGLSSPGQDGLNAYLYRSNLARDRFIELFEEQRRIFSSLSAEDQEYCQEYMSSKFTRAKEKEESK